ncbi:Pex12 amino terminal region-domain-containing protein [Crassisporium funariophilum]|nr:Pex12 amino terminal region-domain-containing protein [Crassisporium funariophilum]
MASRASILETAWNRAQPKLTEIRAALATAPPQHPRIIRVGQLDAELLDQELAHLLQDPISKALSIVSTSFKARFEPELSLLIQLTLYKLSIWDNGASYGARLQGLRYSVPSTSRRILAPSGLPRNALLLHGSLTLFLPYLHNRLRSHALSHAWPDAPSSDYRRKAWDALNSVESLHALFGLVNFIAFLWSGRYRTLSDRILKLSLIPSRRLVKRDVSYEFMNRQMVWHAFTEFLLFLLPLVSARVIRRRVYRALSLLSMPSAYSLLPFRNLVDPKRDSKRVGRNRQKWGYATLPEDQCAICAENATFNLNLSEPTNLFTSLAAGPTTQSIDPSSHSDSPAYPLYTPYQTSCGHIYCYHCIAERMMRTADDAIDESGWECLRCGEEVKEAHRFAVDFTGSEISGSEYEFSSDLDLGTGTDLSGSMGSYSESGVSE